MEPLALLISLALGLLLAFLALTAGVVGGESALKRFDERVMSALVGRRSERIDRVLGPLSMLATQEPLTVQGAVAFAMLLVTLDGKATLHFALAAVGSGVLSQLVKAVVARPRPAVPQLIRWLRGSSYPSADLLTATSIYLTLAIIVGPHLPDRIASSVLFAIVGVVLAVLAACRVYAGVHYPSDVLGGIVLGAAWALAVSAWFA